jgi:preprotein translocase subunit SecG
MRFSIDGNRRGRLLWVAWPASLRPGHLACSLRGVFPDFHTFTAASVTRAADAVPLASPVTFGRLPLMVLALQITLVVTSVLVVLLVLLHRAKGGGLSTLFGGGVQSSLSGSTVVEKNLDRLTLFITGIWLVSIIGVALAIKYHVH